MDTVERVSPLPGFVPCRAARMLDSLPDDENNLDALLEVLRSVPRSSSWDQRRHRILKDHSDKVAADVLAVDDLALNDVVTSQVCGTWRDSTRWHGNQAHDALHCD